MIRALKAQLDEEGRWEIVPEDWPVPEGARVVPSEVRREAFQEAALILLTDIANRNRDIVVELRTLNGESE